MIKSGKYLKFEGWMEGQSGLKYRKISERPICVGNLTGTTHFITGTIYGTKLAGKVSFNCASFCSNYGKEGNYQQGIYKDNTTGELMGWIFKENPSEAEIERERKLKEKFAEHLRVSTEGRKKKTIE